MLFATAAVGVALIAGALAAYDPRYAVGFVGGVAVIVSVLMWPIVGACLLVGVVPATSGLQAGIPVPSLRLSEALIGVVSVTLIASVRRRDAVTWKPLDWLLLLYGLGWAMFGTIAALSDHQPLGIGEWGTIFGQLQFFLVFRGVRVAVRNETDRRKAVAACLLFSLPVSILAILQELHAPGIAALIQRITGGITASDAVSSSSSAVRATGPFDNWAALAGYLLPILLVLVSARVSDVKSQHRSLFIATAALAAVAMAITDEQSVILCLLVGLLVLIRRAELSRRVLRGLMCAGAAVALAAGPLIAARISSELAASAGTGRHSWIPQTLSFRWSIWTGQYLPAIFAHPLTGYGTALPDSIRWQFTESQYISFLIEGGFPMLMLFFVLAGAMLSATRQASRPDKNSQLGGAVSRALTIVLVTMVVVNLVWPFLSNGGMPQILWGLLALAIPRQSVVSKRRRSVQSRWTVKQQRTQAGTETAGLSVPA